jgi:hypothetical protein
MNHRKPPSARRPLATIFRLAGALLILATLGFWAAKGAHTGWSMHRVPTPQVDEVTGLEFVTYEERYVPGVEVLAGGIGAGLLLLGVSLFFHKKSTIKIHE